MTPEEEARQEETLRLAWERIAWREAREREMEVERERERERQQEKQEKQEK